MIKQLKSFIPNQAGSIPYWCLQNVRKGFGIGSKYPTAWQAWLHTQQHGGMPPKNADVPLFYRYYVAGVNKGHVNVMRPNGTVWSDGKAYRNLNDFLSKNKRCTYVGWGESLNGVQILKYVKDPAPTIAMPRVGDVIILKAPVDRTLFKNGTTTVAGHFKFKTDEAYTVRGYDKKYKNRVLINSASVGNGVALALYYTNGVKIPGWRVK